MALAAAVTVAAVVRLGLHARRDEIEIMELVGAPLAFIRGPFVAEGFLQGGIGALLALAAPVGRVPAWRGLVGHESQGMLDGGAVRVPADAAGVCIWCAGGMLVGSAGRSRAPAPAEAA